MTSKTIIPVILAGGKGTRLWPLSRENYPKPLLKLLGKQSLLQDTFKIASKINPEHIVLVANAQHQFMIQNQISELGLTAKIDFLLEPISRNTAPSIALAASYYLNNHDDAIFLILPADHLIKHPEQFIKSVQDTADAIQSDDIVCFGVEPDRPHTGYGYIRAEKNNHPVLNKIQAFIEKPAMEKATELFADDSVYWNCGIFMFRASTIKNEFNALKPAIWNQCQHAINNAKQRAQVIQIQLPDFNLCEDISIDYAILEHTQQGKISIMPCKWSDIGSWFNLWEEGVKDENNNVFVGNNIITHDVTNSYIQSSKRCIAAAGIENQIIIETSDAILVANKNNAQDVKKLVTILNQSEENKPLTITHKLVHRPWGSYESINQSTGFQVKRLLINPTESISLQLHNHRSEHWVIVNGYGKIRKGDETFIIKKGESAFIPKQTLHKLTNIGDEVLEIVETQIGDYLGEDDIIRFEDKYGRVVSDREEEKLAVS